MIVLVPSTISLLPAYSGLSDPVPDLRSACRAAVEELVASARGEIGLVFAPARADNVARGVSVPAGERVARTLLAEAGFEGRVSVGSSPRDLLVVANGTACRSEKAPGHLDERSFAFDHALAAALQGGDVEALRAVDAASGEELWCHDVAAFHALASQLARGAPGEVSFADDPYGVQYWVVTWR